MNLELQVTSLELSKKLKELDIEQESNFYHHYYKKNRDYECIDIHISEKKIDSDFDGRLWTECYSAFTASELIDLLPHRITLKENEPFNSFTLYIKKSFIIKNDYDPLDIWKNPALCTGQIIETVMTYLINYECDSTNMSGEDAWLKRPLFPHNIWDVNFSNALAKTLIHIIENKIK